jgi:hypothetical protein
MAGLTAGARESAAFAPRRTERMTTSARNQPPRYVTPMMQVISRDKEGIPSVNPHEVVTDGDALYTNAETRPWRELPNDERQSWCDYFERMHHLQVAVAEEDPEIRERWYAVWARERDGVKWEDEPTAGRKLLARLIDEASAKRPVPVPEHCPKSFHGQHEADPKTVCLDYDLVDAEDSDYWPVSFKCRHCGRGGHTWLDAEAAWYAVLNSDRLYLTSWDEDYEAQEREWQRTHPPKLITKAKASALRVQAREVAKQLAQMKRAKGASRSTGGGGGR